MKTAIEVARNNDHTLYSQSNTWRWPGRHTIHRQNIAEHHTVVSQLVLLLLDNYDVPKRYHLPALKRAITHDLPESWTNDIPYTIKRDYPKFAKAYDRVEKEIEAGFPKALQNTVPKDTIPWLIVKLADSLDVYLFTRAEIDLGSNNYEINALYYECQSRVAFFEQELKEKLKEA